MPKTAPFDEHAEAYDRWFEANRPAYESELRAVRTLLPRFERAVEIGVGTGRFAAPLGISTGVDPSGPMARIARGRGVRVIEAVAEDLPFGEGLFDLALMVTTVCFLDDVAKAFGEIYRVLCSDGHFVAGIIDLGTEPGKMYRARKPESGFYRPARFMSSEEVWSELEHAGFSDLVCAQTIFEPPEDMRGISPVEPGCGRALFAVMRGRKDTSS